MKPSKRGKNLNNRFLVWGSGKIIASKREAKLLKSTTLMIMGCLIGPTTLFKMGLH